MFSLEGRRVFVAGHRGMVGRALMRRLSVEPVELLTAARAELDLTRQADVEAWMSRNRPEVVIIAAARVGGILANEARPVDFLDDNLSIQNNLIRTSHAVGVDKLLFLGSSCIYPKHAPQPMKEEYLLTGALEPTNQWYALAKIAGVKLCEAHRVQYGVDFISAMPTNLYGPFDNFDLHSSHVLPALLRKMYEAVVDGRDSVVVWGSGDPKREFLHVDDLADACVFLLKNYSAVEPINVGWGVDQSIRELASIIAAAVGFEGRIEYDRTKPDGTPRKLLDVSRLQSLGWRPSIELADGIRSTFDWLKNGSEGVRGMRAVSDQRVRG